MFTVQSRVGTRLESRRYPAVLADTALIIGDARQRLALNDASQMGERHAAMLIEPDAALVRLLALDGDRLNGEVAKGRQYLIACELSGAVHLA